MLLTRSCFAPCTSQIHRSFHTPNKLFRAHILQETPTSTLKKYALIFSLHTGTVLQTPCSRLHQSWAHSQCKPWQQRSPFTRTISPNPQVREHPTLQRPLTTRISVPKNSASACRTNLFLILRCSSMVARMSFCLPMAVEVLLKWCQGNSSS